MIYLAQYRTEDLSLLFLTPSAPSAPSAGSVHLRLPDTSGLLAPTAGSDTRESSLAGAGLTGARLVSPVCVTSPHLTEILTGGVWSTSPSEDAARTLSLIFRETKQH